MDNPMSLKIGRFFGINLYIHWTFWLLPLWVILAPSPEPDLSLPLRLSVLAALFGCVVLHEYGHALTARLFGIATRDVTLYPIGGVARLERMSEKPWDEFSIAIAGPLVNLAIAILLMVGTAAVGLVAPALLAGAAGAFLSILVVGNLFLFGLNLLPAFPMDGGRIFRALLSVFIGRLPATRAAVVVSIGMAVLFGLVGVLVLHNPWLVLIGVFVIWAGQQELLSLEMRERQRHDDAYEEAPPPPWSGSHRSHHSPADVYVWDPRTHQWVFQGVVPSHRPDRSGHAHSV
jgi:Zn-dependent protease